MDSEALQESAERDQLWASLRGLLPVIEALAAGELEVSPQQEQLVTTLVSLGNLADPGRHCDLVAHALSSGRLRSYSLNGGIGSDRVILLNAS